MAVQLAFKRRIHLRDGAPAIVQVRRVSPLLLPMTGYWLLCAALTYGAVCGAVPLRKWLDDDGQAAHFTRRAGSTPRRRAVAVASAEAPANAPPSYGLVPKPFDDEPAPPTAAATLLPEPKRNALPIEPSLDVAAHRADVPAAAVESHRPDEPQRAAIDLRRADEAASALEPHRTEERTVGPEAQHADDALEASFVLTSCEAALAAYNESLDLSGRNVPDLPRAAYAAVLENGGYLLHCGVPTKMSVDICAAIQHGRSVGVTVVTNPPSPRVRACVAAAVRSLAFPVHPRLDVTRTHFDEQH